MIKAVKAWCDEDIHREFISYDNGKHGHDIIRVSVWGIKIKVAVDCTPKNGPQAAVKRCISLLNKKSKLKIQAIVEGRGKIY